MCSIYLLWIWALYWPYFIWIFRIPKQPNKSGIQYQLTIKKNTHMENGRANENKAHTHNQSAHIKSTYQFQCANLNRMVGTLIRLLLILIEILSSVFFSQKLLPSTLRFIHWTKRLFFNIWIYILFSPDKLMHFNVAYNKRWNLSMNFHWNIAFYFDRVPRSIWNQRFNWDLGK